MPSLLEHLDPPYIGKKYIRLELARPLDARRAFLAIDINVTLEAAAVEAGLMLPLELLVTAPSAVNFFRHIYQRSIPSTISFTPREGGEHLVRLAEVAHNRWWGAVVVDVAGEQLAL